MILLFIAIAWCTGVVLGAAGLSDWWPLVLFAGAGSALGFTLSNRRIQGVAMLALALIALAAISRYEAARPPDEPRGVALFNEGVAPIRLHGVVNDEPEERERSQRLVLRVDAYDAGEGWRPTEGAVQVTARLFPRFHYGDVLELEATLETPPSVEGFDYREYLARRGIVSLAVFPQITPVGDGAGSNLVRAIDGVRRPLNDALGRSLPEPEAALAQGILLGERTAIPRDLTDDFNRAGISHLVAISGYNVMLVAGLGVTWLSALLGRRRAIVASMALVVLFALLVGGSPSVLRAAVMGVIVLGAMMAGRPGNGLTAVMLTAALLSIWQPLIVDDVAFQLSFAATLGLVLLSRPFQLIFTPWFERVLPSSLAAFVGESASVTTAASIAALPVTALTFDRVSLVVLPANLVAGIAFPFILATSALTAVAGVISEPLGRIVGQVAYVPLAGLVAVGRFFGGLPGASLEVGDIGWLEALLVLACLILGWLLFLKSARWRSGMLEQPSSLRLSPVLAASALIAIVAIVTWWQMLDGEPRRLTVTVLDVGQGDAILIETPAGQRILIDGGPSGSVLKRALGAELPSDVRRIDLVVLTHAQDDHVTGLVTLLDRHDVGMVLAGSLDGENAAYIAWQDAIARESVPVHEAVAGEWVDLGGGVRLEVLGPPLQPLDGTVDDLNNNSIVLRLVYGDVSFLLTGDLAAAGEQALLDAAGDLRTTVLKVGHHGSDGSTIASFLDAVQPRVAVVSAGANNSFGHPSPTTALRLAGIPLLRTDLNGSVRFETDGRRLWAQPERGGARVIDPALREAAASP